MQLSLISFHVLGTGVPFLEQLASKAVHMTPGRQSKESCLNDTSRKNAN